jgi:hypothetical protein
MGTGKRAYSVMEEDKEEENTLAIFICVQRATIDE